MTLPSEVAARYAERLLQSLGQHGEISGAARHPAIAFQQSGLLDITGKVLPSPLAANLDGAYFAIQALAKKMGRTGALPKIPGSLFAAERALMMNITVNIGRSANGYCRLIQAVDGPIALNLARAEDWALLPAWLEIENIVSWEQIESAVAFRNAAELVNRGSEMGLALAQSQMLEMPASWFRSENLSASRKMTSKAEPALLLDFSGLWAGPLASSLLQKLGIQVIKIEGKNRPDGARGGHSGFFNLLNAGKEMVALDFHDEGDRQLLDRLLQRADMVLEASRPRMFAQLRVHPHEWVAGQPGRIWARMTAYGSDQNRVGFGDDIAISAGLAQWMYAAHGQHQFVGDALADPVSALHAALALLRHVEQGGGVFLEFSMQDILLHAMGDMPENLPALAREWAEIAKNAATRLEPLRTPSQKAKALGADTEKWRAALC